METSREWAQATAAGDTNAMVSYFADDAVMISDGQPPIRGKEAIRSSLSEMAETPGLRITWEPTEAKVSGDMGYLIERTHVTVAGPQGAPVTQNFQGVTIWRKQSDGSWKNVVGISTPAGPGQPVR